MRPQFLIFAAVAALGVSPAHAGDPNVRAGADAYRNSQGTGVRSFVEGLGDDWIIESNTTAYNPRTGQRVTVSASASPRGTNTSVNESRQDLVWFDVPIYVYQNGEFLAGPTGGWAISGYRHEQHPVGSNIYYQVAYDGTNIKRSFSHGPGAVRASRHYVAGETTGAGASVGNDRGNSRRIGWRW